MLDRLIESKLMIAAAREAEIEVEDAAVQEDVEANIAELVRHFGSQSALESELERNGMNLADYRARTTAQLRDRRYMSAVVNRFVRSGIEVREDEVAAYYAAHQAEIGAAPDSVTLGSILVPIQPSAEAQRDLQRKLGLVMQELGAGRPFAEVAGRYTEGPGRERGGSLGTLRHGDLYDRRLEEAVFALGLGRDQSPHRDRSWSARDACRCGRRGGARRQPDLLPDPDRGGRRGRGPRPRRRRARAAAGGRGFRHGGRGSLGRARARPAAANSAPSRSKTSPRASRRRWSGDSRDR